MELTPSSKDEQQSIADIEVCFGILDSIWNSERRHVPTSTSVFAKDNAAFPQYNIDEWAWPLMVVALDHMHMLRRLGGQPPAGLVEWHTHAPWTIMRAALEAVGQLIWLISPHDQDERLQRLLRLARDDMENSHKAFRLLHRPRQRSNIQSLKDAESEFWEIAARYPHPAAQQRIKERINAVDCIKDAARKSGIVKEDVADMLWRVASGHAHGSRWAQLSVGHYELEQELDDDMSVYRGLIDLDAASRLVILVTGFIQYADWLYAKCSGNERPMPDLVAVAHRPKP